MAHGGGVGGWGRRFAVAGEERGREAGFGSGIGFNGRFNG